MSQHLINEYRSELDRLRAVTGSTRETNLRPAFARLLRAWGKQALDLIYVEEHQIRTGMGTLISTDGALLHSLRVPFGYWEAKDAKDDLNREIGDKLRKGYPRDNIIFSDDVTAVLYQDGGEVLRADMHADDANLLGLLERFFAHERQEIADFNKAIKQFADDLPDILKALRDKIAEKNAASADFAQAVQDFLKHARDAINPAVSEDDVREMLIQHILTEDIFAKVFDNPDFHRHNNVAAELKKLEDKLFGYGEKTQLLRGLARYYNGIAQTAALIDTHSEKQGFLKALYEDFYKAYNRKAADRLGVVYTPGEIVRFMIRSADWLCEKHFGKNLIDRGVEILDPATGTGTFIVELMEHFRGNHEKLRHKYKNELHANEVAILPYYVANLNIEATYQAITGQFAEFENLCLVDTLDNVDALGIHSGHQFDLLGSLSDENIERIKRQNRRKISVIIGNPPYNANQQNENDDNKNRAYAHIDKRIKSTYIKASTAQKTKLYDMYARFYRWATDRLGDEGVLAFITNRSFIDSRTFDGFRKTVALDFDEIVVLDLGGDYKRKDFAGGANVFGIGTGVAIGFLIRRSKNSQQAKISYARLDLGDAGDKLSWLESSSLSKLNNLTVITPSTEGDWLYPETSFPAETLPLADKRTKKKAGGARSVFSLFTLGVVTNRDDWVYDADRQNLLRKLEALKAVYDEESERYRNTPKGDRDNFKFSNKVKWTRALKNLARDGKKLVIDASKIVVSQFRPFSRELLYFDSSLNEMQYRNREAFNSEMKGKAICFSTGQRGSFVALATGLVPSLDMFLPNACQSLPRYRFNKAGEFEDNVTDWALNKFKAHYKCEIAEARRLAGLGKSNKAQTFKDSNTGQTSVRVPEATWPTDERGLAGVTKDAIFAYCYAVLHDPVYREKYAQNLKREFPRIPLYPNFAQWVAWGEALMAMHIGYEDVSPWPTQRIDKRNARRAEGTAPKPKLKSRPEVGVVLVDQDTQIAGIPREAWDFRLGSRSAIDWVLNQHKEKLPRDPVIRANFSNYRLADYKESMISLLSRVVRVSVDTVAITKAMAAIDRSKWESEGATHEP